MIEPGKSATTEINPLSTAIMTMLSTWSLSTCRSDAVVSTTTMATPHAEATTRSAARHVLAVFWGAMSAVEITRLLVFLDLNDETGHGETKSDQRSDCGCKVLARHPDCVDPIA